MGFKTIATRNLLATLVAVVVFLGAAPLLSEAQTPPNTVTLAISPQILDLTANPGESITNTFRLTNASSEAVDIVATPKNFTPRGEEGAVDITVDTTSFSLAEWISVTPERTDIQPGRTQDYTVSINVPSEAEPGSHFGSVVFQAIPPEQEGSAALVSQEVAPVILVRIAGDVVESVDITEFKTAKSFYSNESNIEFLSRLENTGNVHFKPTGIISVKNMWGGEVASLDIDKRNVLPDSIRQIPTDWSLSGFSVGRYTATLTVVYGENDEIRVAETSFTVFPYQTLVPAAVIILLIIYIGIRFRKRFILAAKVLSGKDDNREK